MAGHVCAGALGSRINYGKSSEEKSLQTSLVHSLHVYLVGELSSVEYIGTFGSQGSRFFMDGSQQQQQHPSDYQEINSSLLLLGKFAHIVNYITYFLNYLSKAVIAPRPSAACLLPCLSSRVPTLSFWVSVWLLCSHAGWISSLVFLTLFLSPAPFW